VEISQALRLFCKLAHALLPFWDGNPALQRALHMRLEQWTDMRGTDGVLLEDAEFFGVVLGDLAAVGSLDPAIADAIRDAIDVPFEDHINTMFEQALAVARTVYAQHWTGGDSPALRLLGSRNPIHPDQTYFGASGASGSTTPATAMASAEVELLLAPALLGPPTWAAIPYILCHELIAHASQASDSSDETDPFSEGWMDELAREVLIAHADELFPWDPVAAHEWGQRLSDQLRMMGPHLAERDRLARAARMLGAKAAQLVRSVLDSLAGLSSERLSGAQLFERLSIELNTIPSLGSELDLRRHRTFIESIRAGKRDPALAARRDAALRKWTLGKATAREVLSFM
jgi:hypothetical protein